MGNLRVIGINSVDSRVIRAKFSDNLSLDITAQNVTVEGVNPSTPDAQVTAVTVLGDVLNISTFPMTPFVKYKVTLRNLPNIPFASADGQNRILEDGETNVFEILGAENPNNSIRDDLVLLLQDQPYNPAPNTLIRTVFNQIANNLIRARSDIRQTKNDNYLSFIVSDERKVRGYGPFDPLAEEGAYEVIRVGTTPEDQTLAGSLSFDSFPFDRITLQGVTIGQENLEAGTGPGTFDQFILTTRRFPVTKLNSVTFIYQDGYTFEYNIRTFGYQLNNPVFDTQFASTLLTLEDNQIQLNNEVLEDPSFRIPGGGDIVRISYDFKALGRIIDEDSVEVSQVLQSVREPVPAIVTEFNLANAPVVNSSNQIPELGGVTFLDPESAMPFKTTHPAFVNELPFRLEGLPRNPGEYSVDYSTGRVFVYGAQENDGTGNFPPVATYFYRNVFRRDLDYTYRPDTYEVVANPLRDLIGQPASIFFNFEETLVPGIDFNPLVHQEVLNERIQNRLLNSNSLRVLNAPVTNVFRIFNETTGEIYRISRFNNDVVVFSPSTPPSIQDAEGERATFTPVLNEQLIVSTEFNNILGTRVFTIPLLNQNIISGTEDVIGSSYNTSVTFSRQDIFTQELYYDSQILTVQQNTDRLLVGQYQVDYRNGIIYVGVTNAELLSVGTVSYRKPVIQPNNPHVLSVDNIFYSINPAFGVTKTLSYTGFADNEIFPSSFDVSDERFLNGDPTLPYIFNNGTIVVTDDIKTVRHVFDVFDLNNSANPVDFAETATSNANIITLDPNGVEQNGNFIVGSGLAITIPLQSPGFSLSLALSVVRISDGQQLLDGYQTIVGNQIILAASSGAVVGDAVTVLYTIVLNAGSTPVVDYDRGGYFIDYTFLADEILVSYEFGNNVLDFRESSVLSVGQEYFVTYRVGALRDSLLRNFGSLVDIPELNNFDTEIERERYRDALTGALQSFTKGPTIPAMELLVSSITKVRPEIIEAIFQAWSLGFSFLQPRQFIINGNPQFVSGKFDQGLLFQNPGENVTFPISSNLRLEEGTLETWVIPQWDGLANDATLTFSNLTRDGYQIQASNIFIGASSFNPTFDDNNSFSINREDDPSPVGLPGKIFTNTGIFIYYDIDVKRWKVLAKDAVNFLPDGYTYTGKLVSSGEFYDVQPIPGLLEIGDIRRSDEKTIDFNFHINVLDGYSPDGYETNDGYVPGFSFDGIQFMSDDLHYIFDFAQNASQNRFSLFKDGKGYLNFQVWDRGGNGILGPSTRRNQYRVSADIQSWLAGEQHHVAITWKLNTSERRDEIHLFVDGFEVPNIIRYGGIPSAVSTDRFRTVVPEVVVGTVPLNAVTGNDLITDQGSNVVTSSSINFGNEGIAVGNTIEILEQGFVTYTILAVNGNSLTLSAPMPASLNDARFTVNPFSAIVETEIDVYKNIIVSSLLNGVETEIPGVRATIPGYEITRNAFNQRVLKILGDVRQNSQILIRTLGKNHRRARERVFIYGDTQSLLKTQLPPPINLDDVIIRPVILPYVVLNLATNSTIIAGNFVANFTTTQVSNTLEGRQLEVRIAGGNVDFTTPVTVTITGTSTGGPTEVLTFSQAEKQITNFKWQTVTNVEVVATPFVPAGTSAAIEIKEAFSITNSNGNNIFPVIRFAFQTQSGVGLEGDGSAIVSDPTRFFVMSDIGNLIQITSPASVAGIYTIEDRLDNNTIRLNQPTGSAFAGGEYGIFNISIGRSGFQNGFFFLEQAGLTNIPFTLNEGYYEFDYAVFLEVPFDPIDRLDGFIGSDFEGNNVADAVLDEFRILNVALTDTRVGETIALNQDSITTDFNAISAFRKNPQTLVLLDFDSDPLVNNSDYFIFANKDFIQSSESVNENFGQSIVISNQGLVFENKNRLTVGSQGTIEFWVSPKFDTYNDPVPRFYFDAASSEIEEVVSLTKATVQVQGLIGEVLSVRLATDVTNTGTDFFIGGSVAADRRTINLGTALPFQQVLVKVTYIPSGLVGDRISIFKDSNGFITFNVNASGQDFQITTPVLWPRNTWHRVRATFKFNSPNNLDEIRLFVDGEEKGILRFGQGLLFGQGFFFGQNAITVTNQVLIADMNFLDPINLFYIGQDFTGAFPAQARMDNFRLSDRARNPIIVAGQPKDVNFNTNPACVFPVVGNDAFTTFLLDFDRAIERTTDFAILRDPVFGIFNFTINVIDSFGIVSGSQRINDILTAMILTLKPANAKVQINLIE